ncbi:hypothetical protein JW887_05140 [Candidatus Dojkabacteria bacterium]|nr:hypothetical protein [Candidatus Dojkabacteria bacterium]
MKFILKVLNVLLLGSILGVGVLLLKGNSIVDNRVEIVVRADDYFTPVSEIFLSGISKTVYMKDLFEDSEDSYCWNGSCINSSEVIKECNLENESCKVIQLCLTSDDNSEMYSCKYYLVKK